MIKLTEKDADYIANHTRERLRTVNKAADQLIKEAEILFKEVKPKSVKHPELLQIAYERAVEQIEKKRREEAEVLEKIILLMIGGSEDYGRD